MAEFLAHQIFATLSLSGPTMRRHFSGDDHDIEQSFAFPSQQAGSLMRPFAVNLLCSAQWGLGSLSSRAIKTRCPESRSHRYRRIIKENWWIGHHIARLNAASKPWAQISRPERALSLARQICLASLLCQLRPAISLCARHNRHESYLSFFSMIACAWRMEESWSRHVKGIRGEPVELSPFSNASSIDQDTCSARWRASTACAFCFKAGCSWISVYLAMLLWAKAGARPSCLASRERAKEIFP